MKKAIDYIKYLRDLVESNSPDSCLTFEFKLDDDSENSESFFSNEYFDETSQQSTKLNDSEMNQQANPVQYQPNAIEQQSPDPNNNLLNSTINNLSINNFNNDNQANYQPNRNQHPIQNQLNKENILYQNVRFNFRPIFLTC